MLRHLFVITACLVVALVFFLPRLVISRLVPNNFVYSPLSVDSSGAQFAFEEMYAYAPEVQEVLRHGPFLRDATAYEFRNFSSPFLGESLPADIFALLTRLTGTVAQSFSLADLLFPPLCFLGILGLVFQGTRRLAFAGVVALAVTFFWELVYFLPYPTLVSQYLFAPKPGDFLTLGRAFHPQFSFTVLIALLNFVLLALKEKRFFRRALGIALGMIFFGALFYTYIFYWLFAFVWLSLLFLFFLSRKDWPAVWTILVIFSGGLLFGSYYLYNSWQFARSDLAADFNLRVTFPVTAFVPNFLWRYLAFVGLFFFWPRKKRTLDTFLLAALISSVALPVASQLVLGRDLEIFHFIRRLFLPFGLVALFLLGDDLFQRLVKSLRFRHLVYSFLASLLVIIAVNRQFTVAVQSKEAFFQPRSQDQLYSWLNSHTPAGSVVGTIDVVEGLAIAANTHNRLFVPSADRTLLPTSQLVDRFVRLNRLFSTPDPVLLSWVTPGEQGQYGNRRVPSHLLAFRQVEKPEILPPMIRADLAVKNSPGLYRLNYIVVGPLARRLGNFPQGQKLEAVYNNGDYTLYSYLPENL